MLRAWGSGKKTRFPSARLRRRYFSSVSSSNDEQTHNTTQEQFPFSELARTFAAIEQVKQSRDASVRLLATCFRDLLRRPSTPNDLASALYLTASQLAPAYEGVELRFGMRYFAPIVAQLVTDASGLSAGGDNHSETLNMTQFPDFGTAVQSLIDSGHIRIRPHDVNTDNSSQETDGSPQISSISFVHQELLRLASEEGNGAVIRKQQRAVQLLKQCRSTEEMVFLVRMLAHQSLRIGMGEKSILAALAMASAPEPNIQEKQELAEPSLPFPLKQWTESVTKAYAQQPNYAALASLLHANQREQDLTKKIEWLNAHASPTVGVPVLTMSAYPISSVEGVIDRIQKTSSKTASCEYKYDGARVQIHLSLGGDGTQVVGRIFSRNMEDNTEKYGSLLDVLQRQLKNGVNELILEGEVVAVDRATQRFLPFQVLQTKTTTDFCLFAFDLLYLNGEKLIDRSLRDRRTLLRECVSEQAGYLEFVKSLDIDLNAAESSLTEEDQVAALMHNAGVVRDFLQEAVGAGCEGLMVKALEDASDYKAGVRSYSWIKVKQDYLSDSSSLSLDAISTGAKRKPRPQADHGAFLPDTLDLVPIGAFYGKGRRSGVFGSFLMATYNSSTGKFETIGKVGSGFSDVQLSQLSERLRERHVLQNDGTVPENVHSGQIRSRQPDVWLSPDEVWEIKATQLTLSPSYTCASLPTDEEDDGVEVNTGEGVSKGLALRFPRFVRYRPDKNPEHATDSSQVAELFRQQTVNQNGQHDQ
uniref:DNA ligase n=1 Tax=Globisporangium ultimum (strain ATCC 200006 / CBS 805.95 / DAOM BR144) TaxID=431595 RepID=K3WYA7_GLOUD